MSETFRMNIQLFAAEENVITSAQMAKAREVDFVTRFNQYSLKKLLEALGVTRKIPMMEGTTMYVYKTTGTLQSGEVAEGDVIPLSQYQREKRPVGEIALEKWRKGVTAEAIKKSGYDEAMRETDKKMLQDVQNKIRTRFFRHLNNLGGSTVTAGTLQAVLAKSWGRLQVLYENDAVEPVHFINPQTIAEYLATANITTQNAFGMSYIESFLGLGTVVMNSGIPTGSVISTAKENIIMYYLTMTGDVARAFNLTTDDTGYIGMHTSQTDDRAQIETMIMSGIQFLVEYADGVVLGEVNDPSMSGVTVSAGSKTSLWGTDIADLQADIAVTGGAITGTLKYYGDTSKAIVRDWGPGYFIYLKYANFSSGLSYADVKQGLVPSEGTGLLALDSDADALIKVTDKDHQKLKVVQTAPDGRHYVQYFTLSGLTLTGA